MRRDQPDKGNRPAPGDRQPGQCDAHQQQTGAQPLHAYADALGQRVIQLLHARLTGEQRQQRQRQQ